MDRCHGSFMAVFITCIIELRATHLTDDDPVGRMRAFPDKSASDFVLAFDVRRPPKAKGRAPAAA
jgi:hypothetical protein